MSERLKFLKDALVVLASEATAQLDHLKELGLPSGIDELALEYDAIAAAADDMLRTRELRRSQYESVKKLNDLLSRMSGKANAGLWTPDALHTAPEWQEVRRLAKESVQLLDIARSSSKRGR